MLCMFEHRPGGAGDLMSVGSAGEGATARGLGKMQRAGGAAHHVAQRSKTND